MGLVTLKSGNPTLAEAQVAKNYLSPDALHAMEIVSEQFLLYAESKAFRGQKMTMEELLHRLNTLIEVNGYPVLFEYKAFLADKAETHVKQVYYEYQAQLQAPTSKKSLT
ncbi:MAG: hypothetical protein EXR49_06430 [Dehalococcoidia bacterium]|nr:hypothetical protein [Dehalococcoidia bacterium]